MAGVGAKGPATVLLAEDYADTREMMCTLLQLKGCGVVEAAAGQAVVKLAAVHYAVLHLILMDLNLPVLSGYEATRQILDKDQKCHVPVVSGQLAFRLSVR